MERRFPVGRRGRRVALGAWARRARGLAALLAGLASAAPALAEMHEIALPTRDGLELRAMLAKPEGAGPFPAIVALHGCGGLWAKSGKMSYNFV